MKLKSSQLHFSQQHIAIGLQALQATLQLEQVRGEDPFKTAM
jgi:hypothetical protein